MDEKSDLPVHDKIDVLSSETIFKNESWWKSVVACKSWGDTEVTVYLWQNQDGQWKRKQKYKVSDKQEWIATKSIIDDMVNENLD